RRTRGGRTKNERCVQVQRARSMTALYPRIRREVGETQKNRRRKPFGALAIRFSRPNRGAWKKPGRTPGGDGGRCEKPVVLKTPGFWPRPGALQSSCSTQTAP